MRVTDHFLTKENFELKETEIPGVLKTSPVPANIGRYYESKEYISHHQDSGSLKEKIYRFFQKFNLNFKRNILAREIYKNAKILDYGCGAGEFLKFIEDDFTTIGYEPNPAARNAAQQKFTKTTLINSLEEIPNSSLDAITLWHVLEHIEKPEELINIFLSKLKENGLLVIAVPNYTSYDGKHYGEFWAAYDVPRHLFHFSKSGMEKFLESQNLKLKYIKPLLLDSFYISMVSEKYKKSPLFWLKGFIYGAISNFKATKNGEFSSLIYVIGKD